MRAYRRNVRQVNNWVGQEPLETKVNLISDSNLKENVCVPPDPADPAPGKKVPGPTPFQEPPAKPPILSGLTWADFKYNLWAVKLLTLIKILPTDLELKTGRMARRQPATRRSTILYGFWNTFLVLRIVLLVADVIWTTVVARQHKEISGDVPTSNPNIQVHRRIFTFFWTCVISGLYLGFYTAVVMGNHTTNTSLWNYNMGNLQTRIDLPETPGQMSRKRKGKFWRLLRSLSRRPWRAYMLVYTPFIVYSMIPALLTFTVVDPEISILLSSYAVKAHLSSMVYWILILLDLVSLFGFVSLIYYAVSHMLLIIIKAHDDAQLAVYNLRVSHDLEAARRTLRNIQMMMKFFNLTVSYVVYITKLLCIFGAVLGGVGFIRLIRTNTLFAIIYALFFIESNVIHVVVFDKIYRLTASVEELKRFIVKESKTDKRSEFEKSFYHRDCRSVPPVRVQVGGMYLLEQENTIIYADFVLQQIASFLLIF